MRHVHNIPFNYHALIGNPIYCVVTYCIDWKYDGTLVLSCGKEGSLKLCDVREGKVVKTFFLNNGLKFSNRIWKLLLKNRKEKVRWSPDGSMFAAVSNQGDVLLVDFAAEKIMSNCSKEDQCKHNQIIFVSHANFSSYINVFSSRIRNRITISTALFQQWLKNARLSQ